MLRGLKKRLFGSLRKQLVIGVTFIVSLMMSLFLWDMHHRQQEEEMVHNSQHAIALASSLATSSAVWVLSRDFSGLQEIVLGTARYPNLNYVMVLDLDGQVLAHNDPSKIGLYLTDLSTAEEPMLRRTVSMLDVIYPVVLGQNQVGWVRIGLDRSPFIVEQAEMLYSGLFYGLVAVGLSVFFVVLASRLLTRRLYIIQKVADAVQAGNADLRVIMSGDDEAARLAKQFNVMLDSLSLREQQLRSFYDLNLVGLTITSPDKGWIRINDCLCNMLEYSEQALRGMTWAQLTHPDDLAADLEQFNRLLANEIDGYSLEKRFISRTGKIIPVKLVVGCVRKPNHEVDYVTAMVEDISERKQFEEELLLLESRLNLALEYSDIGVWDLDLIHDTAWRSLKHDQIFGYDLPQPTWGTDVYSQHILSDDLDIFRQSFEDARRTGKLLFECRIQQQDRSIHWIIAQGRVVYDENGRPVRMLGTVADITERKLAEREVGIAATLFNSRQCMLVCDVNALILRVNPAFTQVTGYTQNEVIGKNPSFLGSGRHDEDFYRKMWASINDTGVWEGEIWNRRKDGEVYPEYLTITAVKDSKGVVTNYVATFNDITQSKAAENEIRQLAFYDPLTKLPNRRLLSERLKHAVKMSARSGKEAALLFLDLDNFKALNDTLGHAIGDQLLQQVAERLLACVREQDTVARLGGDEFVVMLENLGQHSLAAVEHVEVIANKILTTLNLPYQLAQYPYKNTPSIGVVLFNGRRQQTDDELLKQADIAMYQAKKAGRNSIRFFNPEMQQSINARIAMEFALRKAIEQKQFRLYLQSQVDQHGSIIGAEVLIRWQHPELGLLTPNDFIPLAEETGLILLLGQWVIEESCQLLKSWQAKDAFRALVLSINVSAKQFQQADFIDKLRVAVQSYAIKPGLLKLELTESMLLGDVEDVISKMTALKAIGIQFSLDDFGTGYSSLQYLKRLPLQQLKIDKSFIDDIVIDPSDQAIARTIIVMAQTLGLDVIAEGVETVEQRHILLEIGCMYYQGYLFGKPMPIERFELLL